jgi:mycothiol synthase
VTSDLRPPALDDLPALVELFSHTPAAMTETQLRDLLTSPRSRVDENFRVAVEGGGQIAGWLSIWHPEPDAERVFFHVAAHPRDADMYERLIGWGEERARNLTAGRTGRAHGSAGSENEVLAQILRRRGYELVRHFFTMEINLAAEPPPPVWPEGISVRIFQPGEERAVYDVDMEAFQDHWDFFPVPFDDWREYFVGRSDFDPELWFLAMDGDEIAGTALCAGESRPNIGRVNVLAVRRPWRRRGLGKALLLHAFHELRRRGRPQADLNVDGENLTGAVRLYEHVGMHVARRDDSYRKELS